MSLKYVKNIKNKLIAALAVLFCALLILSAALMIPKNEKSAEAITNSDTITLATKNTSSGKVFEVANLRTLFKRLTGDSNAT